MKKSIGQINKDSGNFKGNYFVAENGLISKSDSTFDSNVLIKGDTTIVQTLSVPDIVEYYTGQGVTIEGVLLKAGTVSVGVSGFVQKITNAPVYDTEVIANSDHTISMQVAGTERYRMHTDGSLQIGGTSTANGLNAIATGSNTNAGFQGSFSQGQNTNANNNNTFAGGFGTSANGLNSHSQGSGTSANGDNSHAQGLNNVASGMNSHSQGSNNVSLGVSSHTEGSACTAQGDNSSAGGSNSVAVAPSEWARANGTFNSVPGSIQTSILQLGSALTSLQVGNITLAMPINLHWLVRAEIVGVDFVTRDMYSEIIVLNAISFGGSVIIKGSPSSLSVVKNGSLVTTQALAPQIYASASNIVYQITSPVANASYWVGSFYITQVAF